jgi:hypothetical protein
MLGLDARRLAVDLGPGIGAVELDVLDVAAWSYLDMPLALLEPLEDLVFDLHVPGVVVLAGLNDSTCGRYCVAATLHLDRGKERLVGDMLLGIELTFHQVAWLEVDEAVRARANQGQDRLRTTLARSLGELPIAPPIPDLRRNQGQ